MSTADTNKMISLLLSAEEASGKPSVLAILLRDGMMNDESIVRMFEMNIKQRVDLIHNHNISCSGKGKRWFSRIDDPLTGKYKTLAGSTEEDLYGKLYEFYFGKKSPHRVKSILEYYPDWLQYKMDTGITSATAKRYDQDFIRYYRDEPLSKPLIEMPANELKISTLKTWAYQMIKKHNMTKRQYGNCALIINQMLDYLVEYEILDSNVFSKFKIKGNVFRPSGKKPAQTQIFLDSERRDLIDLATKYAFEKKDENYLAIPLIFYCGLRIDECLALRFSDFNEKEHSLYVHASYTVKEELLPDGTWATRKYELREYLKGNAEPSWIDIPDACIKLLGQIRQILKEKSIVRDMLFSAGTPNNLQMKLYRLCDELGISRRSPHKERKTYISNLINNGADMDYVREQARHKDLTTTLHSYVYSTSTKQEKIDLLNQVL